MKKILLVLLVVLAGLSVTACARRLSEVESIDLNWVPAERYLLNEVVDLSNVQVTANFTDGTSQTFSVWHADVSISGNINVSTKRLITSVAGINTITVTYRNVTINVDFLVHDPNAPEIWDGETQIEPAVDQVDGAYLIYTASELAWLQSASIVSQDIRLMSDIDLGGHKFWGIGWFQAGTFDGQGHHIYGVTEGLFGSVSDVVFRNMTVHIDLPAEKSPTYGVVALVWWAYNRGVDDPNYIDVLFDHVHLQGSMYSAYSAAGYIGYSGVWWIPEGSDYYGRADIQFINSQNSVSIISTGHNSSPFVGHMSYGRLHFDTATVDYALANASIVATAAGSGILGGGFAYADGLIDTSGDDRDLFALNKTGNYQFVPSGAVINVNAWELGTPFTFDKLSGAVRAEVAMVYSVSNAGGGGYPRIANLVSLNIEAQTSEITAPLVKEFVTQNVELGQQIYYILDENLDYWLDDNITVRIVQFDANDNVLGMTVYRYANQPE